MPLALNISPQTVSVTRSDAMSIVPNSRLAIATSLATKKPNDDTTRGPQECHSKVPIVKLDVDTISDMMASTLASSLLAHVLFLKNQVPLPVMQLAKLSNTKRNNNAIDTRATKQRTELLATYDTLASHLNTTFTSLSTAFARCNRLDVSSRASYEPTLLNDQSKTDEDEANASGQKTARVYVAILVGPSIGSARSKVLLGVDGLETKIWGEREDGPVAGAEVDDSAEDSIEESEGDESEEEEFEESEDEDKEEDDQENEDNKDNSEQEEDGEEVSGEEIDEPSELSDEAEHVLDEDEATPPPSSPSLSSNSLSPSLSPSPSPHVSPKLSPTSIPPLKSSSPTHSHPQTSLTKTTTLPYISQAQQQQNLLSAERLLSRTLALADADGYSLTTDMSPTQTHILIRAPRGFSHSAWIPRQNVTASMEKALEEFLEESGVHSSRTLPTDRPSQNKGKSRKPGQKNAKKVEGVWVVGRRSRIGMDDTDARVEDVKALGDAKCENDDMIWWSWDGKLVGFSDW